jgi:amino acid transporter
MDEQGSQQTLRKGRLGVIGIVFFVVAASAPLVGMTGAVPVAMLAGNGAAAAGTYLLVGLTLLLFSVGFTAMTSKVTNAGAFFAYVGRGMGAKMGVASAFASIVGYVTIQLAIYGFFGGIMAGQMASVGITLDWWAWALIAWVVVTALSMLSVDVGANVLGVLMLAEVLSLFITGVAILVNNPGGMDFNAAFNPTNIFAGGLTGGAGIAIAFAFASFIGFEATAIYGEESKDPKRTVPRATYWAIGIITGLFAIVSFAMVAGLGSSTLVDKVAELSEGGANPAAVLFYLAETNVGSWMVNLMSWLVVSSLFAGLLAFQNANARYFFALGRGGVLPKAFGTTNKAGAPVWGVALTSLLAAAVIALFAVQKLDPILNLFFWMSAITAVAIIAVEVLVSISVFLFFRKNGGASIWQSTIAPLVSAALLIGALYLLMSRFGLLSGLAPSPEASGESWNLTPLGWTLVLSPFVAMVIGYVVASVNKGNSEAMKDMVS